MYIAVAGNIGAGKTTLTNMLSKHYGWAPKFESVDNNPYLDDFYKNPDKLEIMSYNSSKLAVSDTPQRILSVADKLISLKK